LYEPEEKLGPGGSQEHPLILIRLFSVEKHQDWMVRLFFRQFGLPMLFAKIGFVEIQQKNMDKNCSKRY
jgi:hypothetical protein